MWSTNSALTLALAAVTLVAGVLPASVAYVGSLIVDAVVTAMRSGGYFWALLNSPEFVLCP